MEHTHTEQNNTPTPPQKDSFLKELFKTGLIALIIVLPIRIFIAQPFVVQGASMEPTFHNGEYLIVDQISYRFEEPQRGDVIIFRYPKDPDTYFIKRIVGLPGETVTLHDTDITVTAPDGTRTTLPEEYSFDLPPTRNTVSWELGVDEYFVMGDNRDESSDSRTWGALPRELVIGQAFARLLPVATFGVLPGNI